MFGRWAATRARLPPTTELCVVSKLKPLTQMLELYDELHAAGNELLIFGENYQTELIEKLGELAALGRPTPGLAFSFIGKLQTNKIAAMFRADRDLRLIRRVETVDSLRLALRLDEALAKHHRDPLDVYVQVNISQEPQKNGIACTEVRDIIRAIDEQCPHLRCTGLMCVASQQNADAEFAEMDRLRQQLQEETGRPFKLSMGMSADLDAAIRHSTDEVRIGTAIMGAR